MPDATSHDRSKELNRYLPKEGSFCEATAYYRRWRVDPECTRADPCEQNRMEAAIVRTAVWQLVALREATAWEGSKYLPDPRFVNPVRRAEAVRDAMHLMASLSRKFVCEARGDGWSWSELAPLIIPADIYGRRSATVAFEALTGQPTGLVGIETLTWRCSDCQEQITDQGPYGHPSDNESGHAADCERHNREVAQYIRWVSPKIDPKCLRRVSPRQDADTVQKACLAIRTARCACAHCFYCEQPLVHRHEHDHFPVPRAAGGEQLVPACLDCHDLKDRYTLFAWPEKAVIEAMYGILAILDNEDVADIVLIAPVAVLAWWQEQPASANEAVLNHWHELPSLSRVLYAKLRAAKERGWPPAAEGASDEPLVRA